MIEKIFYFFQHTLWEAPLGDKTGWRYFYFKWLKVFSLALKDFIVHRCGLRASALTYYTIFSTIPILALLFWVAAIIGADDSTRQILLDRFAEQKEVFLEAFNLSHQLLEGLHRGSVAVIGFIVLFWSVLNLLRNLETGMNQIWEIKKHRSWRRVLSDYFVLMIIVPIFFFLANSIGFFVRHGLGFHSIFLPYFLFWMLFSFIYWAIPNGKIPTRSAFIGGFIGAGFYLLTKWIYIYFQFQAGRYGAVYGSFAALPLFLVWVQLNWYIFLFGAEVGRAHKTIMNHNN